jgi:hypothetical protein
VTQKIHVRPHSSSSHLRVLPAAPTTAAREAVDHGQTIVQRIAIVSMAGLALNLAWMVFT